MKRGVIAAVIVVVLVLIVGFSIRGRGGSGEKVYAEPAVPRKIESVVTAPGEIDPKYKVNISAHVIGKIEHLYFNEGDTVRKGQKLVELERASYVAQRDRTRADLQSRKIEVVRARTALETAQLEFDRAAKLLREGIQAQELYDKARLDLQNARAGYDSAKQGVEQGAAGVVQAENDLSYTSIDSPIDGKVVELNAREGEVIIPGTMNVAGSMIAVIADMSEILVEAEVGETEVVGIHTGLGAKVHVDAIPEKEYAGHVSEIGASAAVHAGTGNGIRYFKVKVAIDNPDDRLRPGMSSQVSIVTQTEGNALSVPIQSVVDRVPGAKSDDENNDESIPKKKYVFVVKDGKVKMFEVTAGISDATHVAVSGIRQGDMVVTGPFKVLKKLKDGDSVEVSKEEKKSSAGTAAKKDQS
ncbi:MAG TPA: efflux RND transporter periplasmic adaptor subunit [Vicinamibacterales bacterium]